MIAAVARAPRFITFEDIWYRPVYVDYLAFRVVDNGMVTGFKTLWVFSTHCGFITFFENGFTKSLNSCL